MELLSSTVLDNPEAKTAFLSHVLFVILACTIGGNFWFNSKENRYLFSVSFPDVSFGILNIGTDKDTKHVHF